MAWYKVTRDKLSRRLDDPNDKNTYEEYEYFSKGDVLELDGKQEKRLVKMGAVVPATDEEIEAAEAAKERELPEALEEAEEANQEQQDALALLEADRLGAPGERVWDPELAEARRSRAKEQSEAAAEVEAGTKTPTKKTAAPAKQQQPAQQSQ